MKIPKEHLIRDCEEYKKKAVLKSGEVIEYVEFEQVVELMMEIIKYNVVLDDVIVSGKDCKIPMREFGSDKCLICGKKTYEH